MYQVQFRIKSRFGDDELFNRIMQAVEGFGEVHGPHMVEVLPWQSH